jgi:3-hydroxybutyryl-CoA dehydrogenase
MGTGIAQVAAGHGHAVILLDVDLKRATAGKDRIAQALAKVVAKGKMEAAARDALLQRISPAGDLAVLSNAELAIEAATENQELKRQIFRQMDQHLPSGRILASNTSSISITLLAAETSRPEHVVGMHFMNPVPVMQLVEIIPALQTNADTLAQTIALAQRWGKTTITSRDIPGFIVNRVLMPLVNEAVCALYEGLGSAADIDTGCKLGLNHPMGPLALADLIGLDTCLAIMESLHRELGDDRYRPCPLLRQYVAAGWLGRKSGRGFHSYA